MMGYGMVTSEDIHAAESRIRPHIPPTPLELAPSLGDGVWLKLENVNQTHSFKIRGALNALLMLDETARARGIVAASSGNHAQGIAWAAQIVGAQARIVMPEYTARRKIAGVRRWGAEPIIHGETYGAAEREARRLEAEQNLTFVSAYNDARVIA
ncbi:pyridoxal-phosphate dependent enzyme, partial [Anaerolineae bacterium CFX9]|nr:pyridoxal-phosphate dependent enzyme [Anaerolineae bacterium CFX9]